MQQRRPPQRARGMPTIYFAFVKSRFLKVLLLLLILLLSRLDGILAGEVPLDCAAQTNWGCLWSFKISTWQWIGQKQQLAAYEQKQVWASWGNVRLMHGVPRWPSQWHIECHCNSLIGRVWDVALHKVKSSLLNHPTVGSAFIPVPAKTR